jgi:large subunit ribosomal protein L9
VFLHKRPLSAAHYITEPFSSGSECSVSNIQIAEELEKLGHKVDRKIIVVKDAVKEVGSYKAIVKLHKEVSVEIPFEVVAE